MRLSLDKSAWKRVRFGDVVDRAREQWDQSDNSIDRYVAGGHFDHDSVEVSRYGIPEDGGMGSTFTYVFKPGDVLYVSASWYLRKAGVATFSGVVADKTYVMRSRDESTLDQRYLVWILLSDALYSFAAAQATGSMNARLLWGTLARFEFLLPPLADQRRLADLLWSAENHRRALIDATAQLSLARDRSFDFALEAGLAGGEWRSVRVPELVTAGPTNGKSATSNDEERGLPTLSISAIRGGKVLGGDSVKYIDIARAEIESFLLIDGDFLVVRGNGNRNLTGRGGLVLGGLPEDCFYPDLLIRLRFDPTVIHRDFAAQQWNSNRAHAALIKKAKSTNGIWKINGQDIKSHELIVPPLAAQSALLDSLGEYGSTLASVGKEVDALASTRSAMMKEVFG